MENRFTTSRLRAERLREDHWSEVRRMHTDPIVMAQLGGVKTEAESRDYLTRNLEHWAQHGFGLWIVYALTGQEPIGRAVLRRLPLGTEPVDVEVGYGFYEPWWGKGLATELTLALLGLGFHSLPCDSIVAVTSPGNAASQHVLSKCGLTHERDIDLGGSTMCLFRTFRTPAP